MHDTNEKIARLEDVIIKKLFFSEQGDRFNYLNSGRTMLSHRKGIINRKALEQQEEILPDIIAFNDALTAALREMYDQAHRIWEKIKNHDSFGDTVILEAKCFLSYSYPNNHPVQNLNRTALWCLLSDYAWNPLYEDGVTLSPLTLPLESDMSFDSFIGMDSPPPNWNEGLDQELTKDLHLTSAFHHLFDYTMFAITDFIYVRQFQTEINIEIEKEL